MEINLLFSHSINFVSYQINSILTFLCVLHFHFLCYKTRVWVLLFGALKGKRTQNLKKCLRTIQYFTVLVLKRQLLPIPRNFFMWIVPLFFGETTCAPLTPVEENPVYSKSGQFPCKEHLAQIGAGPNQSDLGGKEAHHFVEISMKLSIPPSGGLSPRASGYFWTHPSMSW